MTPKIIFKNLDYIYYKSVKLQKNLKNFKFLKYFYWKHDKATLKSDDLVIEGLGFVNMTFNTNLHRQNTEWNS